MSRKHTELEKSFIEDLPQRTGRCLAEWMAAIEAAGISDRNQIIDWLRPQGFTFAHASWLERIHHNGGRPIYLGPAPAQPQPPRAPAATAGPSAPSSRSLPSAAAPRVVPAPDRPAPPRLPDAAGLDDVLRLAKGLRPLAELVLREVRGAVPAVEIAARDGLLIAAAPRPFAALLPGPREVRLGLVLRPGPLAPALPGRLPGAPADINHIVQLADARLVDNRLIELIALANATANPT